MLSESGGVRCWGENNFGQLGASHSNRIGDNESAFAAASVELGTSAVQLSVGSTHGCALLSNHDVTCWGEGTNGQLGYGNTNNIGDDEPVSVAGAVQLSGKARQVVVGGSHSCAIIDEGQVQCWGSNEFGQLGNGQPGSVGDDETPASVSPLRFALPIKQLALGFDFSCALDIVGNVYCWGENYFGQLGRGDWLQGSDSYEMANDLSPIALGGSTEQIFTGPTGVCALRTDGALYCWGDNSMGQIGYDQFDAIGDDEFPVDVGALPIGSGIKSVALGMSHSCALFHDGTVKCWGDNSDGQLGLDGGNSTGLTAAAVEAMPVSLGGVASDIASGSGFSCAVLVTGGVRCWGANDAGQLGRGNTTNIGLNETPAVVGDVPMSYVSAATWQFVNPKDLTVWLSVPSSRGSTTAISLALSSPKRHVVEALKAFYNFQIAIPEKGTPKLFDWDTPFSTPQIESGEGNAFSIVFNYSSVGSVEVGREHHLRRRVERVGLGVGSLESGGNGQNDYGLSDRASSCAWYQTQRIQIADASGRLVYGWTPR
jgi:alpha-tubulin suppressor-like RCC1 family protein